MKRSMAVVAVLSVTVACSGGAVPPEAAFGAVDKTQQTLPEVRRDFWAIEVDVGPSVVSRFSVPESEALPDVHHCGGGGPVS